MFESYIRGVFYYNYSSCHQPHTVALSFLPYAAGKQQLLLQMPKTRHLRQWKSSQRDNRFSIRDYKALYKRVIRLDGSFLCLIIEKHWFYGIFSGFVEGIKLNERENFLYFSLGDREARTRNALLSTVEDKTGKVYDQYKNKGIETTFEMNPGNHFKDADLRLAKGIAWILK